MKDTMISIIASATLRTTAYLEELIANNIKLEHVLILDDPSNLIPGQRSEDARGVLGKHILNTCDEHGIAYSCHPADVNSQSVLAVIENLDSEVIVYSGFGGQLVKKDLLATGKKFLHVHSGVLPEYRGSTTVYYAILNGDKCGATAILLDDKIDTGQIVGAQTFEVSKNLEDIDFGFDVEIRKKLLVSVISDYVKHGEFLRRETQDHSKGDTYYVAHPVIRHLAILSTDR